MPRRVQHIVRTALLVAGTVISSVAATEACTYLAADSPAACEIYKKADVAFVGRATSVPPHSAGGQVRFQVTQALKGVAGPQVTVLSAAAYSCGYQFIAGEEYVVFAARNAAGDIESGPGTIWMVHVPDSSSAEYRVEAAEAVAFVASLRKPAAGGRIFGEVRVLVRDPFSGGIKDRSPVDGATAILRGPVRKRVTTGVSGRYEFTGLPRGTYQVNVTMPPGFPAARSARPSEQLLSRPDFQLDYEPEATRRITIADDRGCGYAPFDSGPVKQ
jgi:hypothetical protein